MNDFFKVVSIIWWKFGEGWEKMFEE